MRAVFGILPNTSFVRQDAKRCTLEACATQKRDHPLRKFRQLIPAHCAFAFFAAQMRLGQQFTQIFVTRTAFDQDRHNAVVFHRQFGANDWTHVTFARSH